MIYDSHSRVKYKESAANLCTKDLDSAANSLDSMAITCMSASENLSPITMSTVCPTVVLKPMTMTHRSLIYGDVLGSPKGQWWNIENLCRLSEGSVVLVWGFHTNSQEVTLKIKTRASQKRTTAILCEKEQSSWIVTTKFMFMDPSSQAPPGEPMTAKSNNS